MSRSSTTRIGFLVAPGNPTTEPEMYRIAPPGVTMHFTRMVAGSGEPGSHAGQDARNRSHIAHLDENLELIAAVKPAVVAMAHTATSYTMGKEGEAQIVERLSRKHGFPFITAFGGVIAALAHLGATRVVLGAPYSAEGTQKSRAHLEAHGVEVLGTAHLENVGNIYDETSDRALALARRVDTPDAQAVVLSGLGMPSIDILEAAEAELGKPVISGAAAMMWHALGVAGVATPIAGCGSLLGTVRRT